MFTTEFTKFSVYEFTRLRYREHTHMGVYSRCNALGTKSALHRYHPQRQMPCLVWLRWTRAGSVV